MDNKILIKVKDPITGNWVILNKDNGIKNTRVRVTNQDPNDGTLWVSVDDVRGNKNKEEGFKLSSLGIIKKNNLGGIKKSVSAQLGFYAYPENASSVPSSVVSTLSKQNTEISTKMFNTINYDFTEEANAEKVEDPKNNPKYKNIISDFINIISYRVNYGSYVDLSLIKGFVFDTESDPRVKEVIDLLKRINNDETKIVDHKYIGVYEIPVYLLYKDGSRSENLDVFHFGVFDYSGGKYITDDLVVNITYNKTDKTLTFYAGAGSAQKGHNITFEYVTANGIQTATTKTDSNGNVNYKVENVEGLTSNVCKYYFEHGIPWTKDITFQE